MSVKLNRPPKPEESQKNSNFNGKTIPYPGFEPGTSGLLVGSHNHCSIWSVISEHANRILGCSLDTYYNLRICGVMYRLIGSGRLGYLFDGLLFGGSARLFNLIIPTVVVLCTICGRVHRALAGLKRLVDVTLFAVRLHLIVALVIFLFIYLTCVYFALDT
jgi:hypothetical protein